MRGLSLSAHAHARRNRNRSHGQQGLDPGGGHYPVWSDRDVPPVRAGFSSKISLKPGIKIAKIKVKTGLKEIRG